MKFLFSAFLVYGKQLRQTRNSHMWKGNMDATETNPAGSMVATDRTIYTMDTELGWWCQAGRKSLWTLPAFLLEMTGFSQLPGTF